MKGEMVVFVSGLHVERHDAMITEEFSDTLVNLTVFPVQAAPFDVGAVYRPAEFARPPESKYACWWERLP